MNKKGDIVSDENQAYGCKVKTRLTRPDMCIVMDEVGANTSQLKDGHIGGTRYVVGKSKEARQLATKREKHFTCLGLTLLNGDPLMCVVIIEGKHRNLLVETGIDMEASEQVMEENESQFDYFINNMGGNKKYPSGPSCTYQGIEVPCMVEFTEGGGINSHILTKIFQTLDFLKIFEEDRKLGYRPYVILDGHQSRFDLDFLTYVNDENHRWSIVIGVPYGTALWQVGDSVQQNGMFKVWLSKRKEHLMQVRESMKSELEIVPTDIIPLVIYAWDRSFVNVVTNKLAILERGWFPLNKNLLLHPLLRATMTPNDKDEEKKTGLVPSSYHKDSTINTSSSSPDSGSTISTSSPESTTVTPTNNTSTQTPTTNQPTTNTNTSTSIHTSDPTTSIHPTFNFGSGLSASILDRLVSKSDLNASRKRNIESKRKGESMEIRMQKMTRKSAAQLVTVAQTHVLGQPLRNRVRSDYIKLQQVQLASRRKKEEQYRTLCNNADAVMLKNESKTDFSLWSMVDLKTVIKPLKKKSDGPLPSHKSDILDMWTNVKDRERVPFDDSIMLDVNVGDDDVTIGNDAKLTGI
jgi:hypothetical protein